MKHEVHVLGKKKNNVLLKKVFSFFVFDFEFFQFNFLKIIFRSEEHTSELQSP